jgi:hypothetical protein
MALTSVILDKYISELHTLQAHQKDILDQLQAHQQEVMTHMSVINNYIYKWNTMIDTLGYSLGKTQDAVTASEQYTSLMREAFLSDQPTLAAIISPSI